MISAGKFFAFAASYLVVFAFVPGLYAEFERVADTERLATLLSCGLFVVGMAMGARSLPGTLTAHRLAEAGSARGDRRGLWLLALALAVASAYMVVAGPHPPVLAASEGADAIAVALIREEAVKLNEDAVFVRIYTFARDLLAPIGFALALDALLRPRGRRPWLVATLALVLSLFVGLWSAQKATVVNYAVAAILFMARDTRHLTRMLAVAVPLIAAFVVALFAFTYEGFFASDDTDQVQESVVSGLLERVFHSPFEVSLAYVDAARDGLIQASDALPIVGALIAPGRPTMENAVGLHYFFSGIDSVSANALSFAYAYVIGGLPMSFIAGLAVPLVFALGLRLVEGGRNAFVVRCYGAYLFYLLLDLLNGNVISYLMRGLQTAVALWLLASLLNGLAMLRTPAPPAARAA